MSVKLQLKIGRTPVVIEAPTLKECFVETELICQLPPVCGHCGSDHLLPSYSRSDAYEFFFLRCGECKHELKFGQRKSDKGLFPKLDDGEDGWVEPFGRGRRQPDEDAPARRPTSSSTSSSTSSFTQAAGDEDDIPF